jgi:hypothetical protein
VPLNGWLGEEELRSQLPGVIAFLGFSLSVSEALLSRCHWAGVVLAIFEKLKIGWRPMRLAGGGELESSPCR